MTWEDSNYWSFWAYRLFIGYAPDGEASDFKDAWAEAQGGRHLWCRKFGSHVFAVGWALPPDDSNLDAAD